jgi:DNA-directed RNA polymerase
MNIDTIELLLEEDALTGGRDRFASTQARSLKEGADRTRAATRIIRGAVPILAAAIEAWKAGYATAKGRKPTAYTALSLIPAETAAAAVLTQAFKALGDGGNLTPLVTALGRTIEVEVEAAAIRERDPKMAAKFQSAAKGATRGTRLVKRHTDLADGLEVRLGWSEDTRSLVGGNLLSIALEALSEVFTTVTEKLNGKAHQVVLRLTDEAAATMANMDEAASWMTPIHLPMVTMPNRWEALDTGAYHDDRLRRTVDLVRTYSKEHRAVLKEALADGSMQTTMDAVHAIQETAWRIDTGIVETIRWCRAEGLQPGDSFPRTHCPPVPDKVDDAEWELMDPAKRQVLSKRRKAIRTLNRSAKVSLAGLTADLGVAEKLAGHTFYLPHSLDFRSRIYAVPGFNNQRSDHIKAMFRFAEKRPVGEGGGLWLLVHCANSGDFGKVSKGNFAERLDWAETNMTNIFATAMDAEIMYDWWSQADSPLVFLQACREVYAWVRSGRSPEFLSDLPVAADGSCSGLQHYSCMTRSEPEARLVNLLAADRPNDIYRATAEAGKALLELAAAEGDLAAQKVLEAEYGRSIVKRNVMTYFYGSRKYGMRAQHMEDTMRPLGDKVVMGDIPTHPYELPKERVDPETGEVTIGVDGGFQCAEALAKHTLDAVRSIAPKADEASGFIQDVAALLASEGHSMTWKTPAGFPVIHRYEEANVSRVSLWLYDREILIPKAMDKIAQDGSVLKRIELTVSSGSSGTIDTRRMKSAASPNLVHSMDASHLQLAVSTAHALGLRSFSMIHDSFGTHAGEMDQFIAIVRGSLIANYRDYCPLQAIHDHASSVLSPEGLAKLPEVPAKGTLDLDLIHDAMYAFA